VDNVVRYRSAGAQEADGDGLTLGLVKKSPYFKTNKNQWFKCETMLKQSEFSWMAQFPAQAAWCCAQPAARSIRGRKSYGRRLPAAIIPPDLWSDR
jgi:hypothetical protein